MQFFSQYYQPSRHFSIDEMMIGTICRIAFLQYIPKKLTCFGIKVWVNSEAKTGYVLCFQVYTGANSKTTREKGLGYRECYKMKGHCLFIDNFYTSFIQVHYFCVTYLQQERTALALFDQIERISSKD